MCLGVSSSSTKGADLSCAPVYLSSSPWISEPPSLSKLRRSTSLLSVTRSRGMARAAAVAAAGVLPAGLAVALALVAPGGCEAAVVGAVAVAVGGPGKKVAWRPLCTCHLSHSKTREKPNITHRMVRRMSFMKTSLQRKVDGEARQHQRGQAPWPSGETAPGPAQARDHGRLRTRDGSVQCGAA